MTCVRGCITQVALFSNNHFTENLLHRIITSWDVKFKTIWLKQKLFDFKIIRFSRISDVVRRKYKIKSQSNEINWVHLSHVDYFMFCQVFFSMWKLCCICCMGKVSPQSASSCERLFSCVHPYHVPFQLSSCNAGKFASFASVRLFPRVGSFVPLQSACLCCCIIALIAFVGFLSSVFHNVRS